MSRRVTLALLGVATPAIIIVVAIVSAPGSFPDESLHVASGKFYADHWLPPPIDDQLVPYAGVHGVSYFMLWPPQASYIIYEKALQLTVSHTVERWKVYRALSCILWVLFLFAAWRRTAKHPAIFLLVGATPQVWYLFTYFSADALSYVAASLVAIELGCGDSASRRFLSTGTPRYGALVLGSLVAILLLSKLNYYTFVLFAIAYAVTLGVRATHRGDFVKRAVGIVAIALAIAGPFLVTDAVRNMENRSGRIDAFREAHAGPGFKPSDVASGNCYPGLGLRQRGVTAAALFSRPWDWATITIRSFFGLYGRVTIPGPPLVNLALRMCFAALCVMLVVGRERSRKRVGRALLAAGSLLLLTTVTVAFWRAWTFDFQAQGRYVFAVLPIGVLMLLEVEGEHVSRWFWRTATFALCLGLASLGWAAQSL